MAKVYADLIKRASRPWMMSRLSSGMMWRLCLRRTAMCKLRELLLYILLRKEVECMAVVYATLIVKGSRLLSRCPASSRARWRKSWWLWRWRSKSSKPSEKGLLQNSPFSIL